MKIDMKRSGTALTVIPEGRLDTATSPELKSLLDENINGVTELTFDLAKLVYLSSAGLRVLMSAQKTMDKQGQMKLQNVNEDVLEILDMVGLTDVFTIEE